MGVDAAEARAYWRWPARTAGRVEVYDLRNDFAAPVSSRAAATTREKFPASRHGGIRAADEGGCCRRTFLGGFSRRASTRGMPRQKASRWTAAHNL